MSTVDARVLALFDAYCDEFAIKLDKAFAHAGHTHDRAWLRAAISSGRAQFWPTADGFHITEIVTWPTGKTTGNMWLSVGSATPEMLEMFDRAVAWLLSHEGVSEIRASARRGYERRIGGRGFRCVAGEWRLVK